MGIPSRPLRVHVLIDSLTWGGAEMLLADLAAAAPAAGIELSVGYLNEYEGSPAAVGLRAQGVEPELVRGSRLLDPGAIPRLRRHLARIRPDVVHTHLELSDVLGTLAARSLGLPAVSTIHLVARQPTGQPADATRRAPVKARIAAAVRRHAGARLIAVSCAARDAYLQTGWDTPRRVVVVHNGIARSASPDAGARVRRELGLDGEALVVTILTVLRPGKGHEVVFGAIGDLLGRFPNLRLVVLGEGPARARLQELARPLGPAVLFTGHRGDVMDVLAASDVLVHPTLMDAFPTALLEAGAARVPVVATRVGGIPEIVDDETTGLLVDVPPDAGELATKLARLLADSGLRLRVGEQAHARFRERFTAELWARALRGVYEEVLAERPSRSTPRRARQAASAAPTPVRQRGTRPRQRS